jgi:hypothetical protein
MRFGPASSKTTDSKAFDHRRHRYRPHDEQSDIIPDHNPPSPKKSRPSPTVSPNLPTSNGPCPELPKVPIKRPSRITKER